MPPRPSRPRVAGLRHRPSITSQPWSPVPDHLRRDMHRDVVVDMRVGPADVRPDLPRPVRRSSTCCAPRSPAARHLHVPARPAGARRRSRPASCSSTRRYTLRLSLHRYRPARRPRSAGCSCARCGARDELTSRPTASTRPTAWSPADLATLWANQRTRDVHVPRRRGRHHRRHRRHRHRGRPRPRLQRPGRRQQPVVRSPSTRSPAARRRRGAGPDPGPALPGPRPVVDGPVRPATTTPRRSRCTRSSGSSRVPVFASSARTRSTSRCSPAARAARRPQPLRADRRRRGAAARGSRSR